MSTTNRQKRAAIARETLSIIECGFYLNSTGERVDISGPLQNAISKTVLYTPEMFKSIFRERDELMQGKKRMKTRFKVTNESILSAGYRISREMPVEHSRIVGLNFASAKHPGGGFIKGSNSQEESLARASGLHACLSRIKEMYEANRQFKSNLYTDHLVYSPGVPVFRDDNDMLLDEPWFFSIISAPAVNAGAVRKYEPWNVSKIDNVMLNRIEKVLSVAVIHSHDTLVLGAWGCGVFRNDARSVASWFHEHLVKGKFANWFKEVIFAVLDRSRNKKIFSVFDEFFNSN
ncbi:MAG: TIGR02452 family protein [Promethearchaeota archaeon]